MGRVASAWSLSGAVVGLTFLLIIALPCLSSASKLFYQAQMGPGYWLAAIGCMFGIIGTLLGLLERQAAPVAIGAVEASVQQ